MIVKRTLSVNHPWSSTVTANTLLDGNVHMQTHIWVQLSDKLSHTVERVREGAAHAFAAHTMSSHEPTVAELQWLPQDCH